MLFGRAQEEIAALEAAGVAYEVVPGVTAALAAAAQVRTSLTQRGSVRSVALITPRVGADEKPNPWIDSVASADAAAIYMGAGEAEAISAALIAAGKDPGMPVALVESASLPESRTHYTTLARLPALEGRAFSGPVMLLLGPQFHARAARRADEEARDSPASAEIAARSNR